MKKTLLSVMALTLSLAACAVNPKISDLSTVYIDSWVKRNNPQVYVEPLRSPPRPTTALIVPFQVTQDVYAPKELGEQVTRVLWQTWTRDRVFPRLLYEPKAIFNNFQQNVALARKMGADMLIAGQVTYLLAGGTRGDTAVSLSVEAYDVGTGERIWSMAHAGRVETALREDYILFFRENRLPMDPLYAIISVLSADMGGRVTNWNYGQVAPGQAVSEPPNPPEPQPGPPTVGAPPATGTTTERYLPN